MSSKSILFAAVIMTGLALTACTHDRTRSQHGMMKQNAMSCKHMQDNSNKAEAEKASPAADGHSNDRKESGCGMMEKSKQQAPENADAHTDHK